MSDTLAALQSQKAGIESQIAGWQQIIATPGTSASYRTHAEQEIGSLQQQINNINQQILQFQSDLSAAQAAAIAAQLLAQQQADAAGAAAAAAAAAAAQQAAAQTAAQQAAAAAAVAAAQQQLQQQQQAAAQAAAAALAAAQAQQAAATTYAQQQAAAQAIAAAQQAQQQQQQAVAAQQAAAQALADAQASGNAAALAAAQQQQQQAAILAQQAAAATSLQQVQVANQQAQQAQQGLSNLQGDYSGLSTALGGTWGKTPQTLAQATVDPSIIKYTVTTKEGVTRQATPEESALIVKAAVEELTPQQKIKYEAEVKRIEGSGGGTVQEKLISAQQTSQQQYAQSKQFDGEAALQAQAIQAAQKEYGIAPSQFVEGSATRTIQPVEVLKTGSQPAMVQAEGKVDKPTAAILASDYVKVGEGQYMKNAEWAHLTKEEQQFIIDKGLVEYQDKKLKEENVKVGEGEYMTNAEWAHLSKEDQQLISDKGLKSYMEAQPKVELKSGERILKSDYDNLPAPMQKALMTGGFEAINLDKLKPEDKFKKMQEWDMIPKDAEFTGIDSEGNITYQPTDKTMKREVPWYQDAWESLTPWDEVKGETVTAEGAGIMAAETFIPLVYSIRNWDKMSDTERALSLGMDVLSIGLIFIPGIRGVSTAVRMGSSIPKALLKGAGTAAAELTYRQVSDPVRMLMHPVEMAKAPLKLFKEIAGGKTVPYEVVSRGIKGAGWGSDMKLAVGGGNEVSGATLEAVSELTKAGQAGTKAETMVGTKLVKFSNTGFEKIAGRPIQTHSNPGIEVMLQEIADTGAVTVKGREKGLFSSIGGTEFWRQSAFGGMGQIPGGMHIEGAVDFLPEAVAKLRDPMQTEKAMIALAEQDLLKGKATTGSKIYQNTAEFESVTWEGTKIKPVVTDKYKTFKWKEPEPVLAAKSTELMQQASEAEKMAKQADTVEEAAAHLKNSDKLAKESVETFKEAVKKGTPKEVRTNIDYLETIDPITGQNLIYLHTVLEGQEAMAKPWTKSQIAGWKVKGFMNIPRDIFVPALATPKISAEVQIQKTLERFSEPEKQRFLAGLDLLDILGKTKPPAKTMKFTIADIEAIPKEAVPELEKWFSKNDHRIYGSVVEWAQARSPNMKPPGDLDFAVNNPEKAINEIAEILKKHYPGEIKVETRELFGHPFSSIKRVSDGETIMEAGSMLGHVSDLPYGLQAGRPPIKVGNFKMEELGEQFHRRGSSLLFPGFGPEGSKVGEVGLAKMAEVGMPSVLTTEGRSSFGVVAASKWTRLKDIGKFQNAAEGLIDAMRTEAKTLNPVAAKLKLAEADRAEALLKQFMKNPTADDMAELGLKANASLDEYYDALGKRFKATTTEIVESVPQINPDKYLPEYEARVKAKKGVEKYVGEYQQQKLAERAFEGVSATSPIRQSLSGAGRITARVDKPFDIIGDTLPTRATVETPRAREGVDLMGNRVGKSRIDQIETGRIAVERISLDRITPERITPDRITPERITPDRVTPERITPDRITPDRVTPERTTPDRVTPDRITPERITPDRITPDRITPDRITPERITPDRITPDRITPDRITPERVPPRKVPPERIKPPDGTIKPTKLKFEDLTRDQLDGAVAWKQGFIYKLWVKPFGQADIINSKQPIPGVKYHTGIGSAAQSLIVTYGEIPKHIKRDMGVVDIDVFRAKEGGKQPTIKFKPDSKQKTSYSGIVTTSDTGGQS
jgi:hypothetical protein